MKFKKVSLATILGSAFTAFGLVFATTPGLVNKIGGRFLPDGPEVRLLIRLVGMRDISLGVGLLANQANPAIVPLCRKMMAFNTGTDLLLLGFFLPRSTIKLKVALALVVSAFVTFLALLGSDSQEQKAGK